VNTLDRLLAQTGRGLDSARRPGAGVDRTTIRQLLAVRPAERLRLAAREAANLDRLVKVARRR
jgi:hypothetical protein